MNGPDDQLFRQSDPAKLKPLSIVKAALAFPDTWDGSVQCDVLLQLDRDISPMESLVLERIRLPLRAKYPSATVSLQSAQVLRLSGIAPELVRENSEALGLFVRELSEHASVAFDQYAKIHNELVKIKFPPPTA